MFSQLLVKTCNCGMQMQAHGHATEAAGPANRQQAHGHATAGSRKHLGDLVLIMEGLTCDNTSNFGPMSRATMCTHILSTIHVMGSLAGAVFIATTHTYSGRHLEPLAPMNCDQYWLCRCNCIGCVCDR